MSSNSIFTSVDSGRRWVLEIAKNFPQEHVVEIDFDTPFCVFKVPKTLTETKPEAYTPKKIGLGPYHHLRPDLYTTQKQKLSAVRKFMNQENLNNVHKVVEALIQWEPVLRACYDQYLDLDAETLAWIVAVDGLYLLQFLRNLRKTEIHEKSALDIIILDNSNKCDPEIESDIIMLENQIPAVLLKKILHVLENDTHTLFEDFDVFYRKYSPLELSKNKKILQDKKQDHLLHRMYHLIVNNRGIMELLPPTTRMNFFSDPISADDFHSSFQFLRTQGIGMAGTAENVLSFVEKVQWDKIKALFKKQDPDEQNPLVEEINIPSVTQMSEIAGITFTLTPKGIRDIRFNEEERKLYLPVITINVHTETILRNLVAFELSKTGSTHAFALYVDLMCGIIDTKKDVEIHKKAKIIKVGLPEDDEIVRIFNGIRRSTEENDKEMSNIKQAIDDANEKYDDVGSVKVKRFLKKYFSDSWKYIRVVVSVVVVVLLTLQAFCSVFGCARWFGGSAAVKGGHFLYAA